MALTRDFKTTVQERARRDPNFRVGLLEEGLESLLNGDLETAKILLRDYINATVGFKNLGKATGLPAKSVIRMFGPSGNPASQNLSKIVDYLRKEEHVSLKVQARAA